MKSKTRTKPPTKLPPLDRSWSAGQGKDRRVVVHCFRCKEPVATQKFDTIQALAHGKFFALCCTCYGLLLEKRKERS